MSTARRAPERDGLRGSAFLGCEEQTGHAGSRPGAHRTPPGAAPRGRGRRHGRTVHPALAEALG